MVRVLPPPPSSVTKARKEATVIRLEDVENERAERAPEQDGDTSLTDILDVGSLESELNIHSLELSPRAERDLQTFQEILDSIMRSGRSSRRQTTNPTEKELRTFRDFLGALGRSTRWTPRRPTSTTIDTNTASDSSIDTFESAGAVFRYYMEAESKRRRKRLKKRLFLFFILMIGIYIAFILIRWTMHRAEA